VHALGLRQVVQSPRQSRTAHAHPLQPPPLSAVRPHHDDHDRHAPLSHTGPTSLHTRIRTSSHDLAHVYVIAYTLHSIPYGAHSHPCLIPIYVQPLRLVAKSALFTHMTYVCSFVLLTMYASSVFLQDRARLTCHVTAFPRTRVIRVIMHGLLLALLIQLRSISNIS
jgi:hypothetical protein